MISSEVQRTLVKSPPELWTELSDPASLGRHLGEFGEVRITRAEAEKRVDWEADSASGSILIKPSGWGTKVTLSVAREVALPEPRPVVEDPGEAPDASTTPDASEALDAVDTSAETLPAEPSGTEDTPPEAPEQLAVDPLPSVTADAEAPAESAEADDETPVAAEPTPPTETLPRRGFFARLFGRRRPASSEGPSPTSRAADAGQESEPLAVDEQQPLITGSALEETGKAGTAIESLQARFQREPEPEPSPSEAAELAEEPDASAEETAESDDDQPERAIDLAAELKAAEEVAVEEVTAVLTSVLDRLGAAHHRPFSRA